MQLKVSFKDPKHGMYTMYITPKEHIQVVHGKIKRIPPNVKALVNTVPLKYLTSITIIRSPYQTCNICQQERKKVVCYSCLLKLISKTKQAEQIERVK